MHHSGRITGDSDITRITGSGEQAKIGQREELPTTRQSCDCPARRVRITAANRIVGVLTGAIGESDLPVFIPSEVEGLELNAALKCEYQVTTFAVKSCPFSGPAAQGLLEFFDRVYV